MWLRLEGVKVGQGPLSGSEPLKLPCWLMKQCDNLQQLQHGHDNKLGKPRKEAS